MQTITFHLLNNFQVLPPKYFYFSQPKYETINDINYDMA